MIERTGEGVAVAMPSEAGRENMVGQGDLPSGTSIGNELGGGGSFLS